MPAAMSFFMSLPPVLFERGRGELGYACGKNSGKVRPCPLASEAAARELRARLAEWQAGDARVVRADALRYLAGEARPFDLVFLDPPFASELLGEAARLLEERHWLKPGALIYVECAARAGLPLLPAPWRALRAKQAGEVGYHLFAHTAPVAADTA